MGTEIIAYTRRIGPLEQLWVAFRRQRRGFDPEVFEPLPVRTFGSYEVSESQLRVEGYKSCVDIVRWRRLQAS